MLTCRELTEIMTDYLEGRMRPMRRLEFQIHLGMCGRCRVYLRQMRATIKALGALPTRPAPPEVTAELLRRFRSWKSVEHAGEAD
jgi:anti-sigma factor RsiW